MARDDKLKLRITRSIDIPDLVKLGRFAKAPELGPRLLFFSGGTAVNGLSQRLKAFTHNSIHLITPFDSGGSSAALRQAFDMPAIGDLRNRLMALADDSVLGNPEVYQLFNYRLPQDLDASSLRVMLQAMVSGAHERVADIPPPMQQLICQQLAALQAALPADFDLRGASVGNLILAGGYITNGNNLDATLLLFSRLVNVQGTVRAIVNDNAHLVARLVDGSMVLGQHRLTGKELPPIAVPIESVFLSDQPDAIVPRDVQLQGKNSSLIGEAELICYAPGSFYSSLIASLLPRGVGQAVASNPCPKVYIPNLGEDPEQVGMDFEAAIHQLLKQLASDDPSLPASALLNYVIVDRRNGRYPSPVSTEKLEALGIELIDVSLVTGSSAPYYDDQRILQTLLSLV